MIGKEREAAVSPYACPCLGCNRRAVGGASVAKSGDVKKESAMVEADELHLFQPELMNVVQDVTVMFAGSLSGGGVIR